jgi:cysteine-rich secretory family protein
MKHRTAWLVAPALSLMLAVPAAMLAMTAPARAATAPATGAQFMSLMNSDRAGAGLAGLSEDPSLDAIAQNWSNNLARQGSLSHNPNLASQLPANWVSYGENVGMGQNAPQLEQAFMGSPEHRANILGTYTLAGVGVVTTSNGTVWVTVDFMLPGGNAVAASCHDSDPADVPSAQAADGYYVLGSDGGIFSYGSAPFRGSLPGQGIHAQAVLMSLTPDQAGYYILGSDGGVFTFGDAHFYGSVPGTGSHTTGVDLKPTPDGHGYWVLGSDGSVFSFGDAKYFGSLPGSGVHDQAVKLVPTATGHGYWILGSDGGVFSFGDAHGMGSLTTAGVHDAAVSMAATPTDNGYWILGADGGIFSFGAAAYHGSVPGLGCQTAQGVQLIATSTGGGYYILSSDGRVFPFGDAPMFGEPYSLHVSTLDLAVMR